MSLGRHKPMLVERLGGRCRWNSLARSLDRWLYNSARMQQGRHQTRRPTTADAMPDSAAPAEAMPCVPAITNAVVNSLQSKPVVYRSRNTIGAGVSQDRLWSTGPLAREGGGVMTPTQCTCSPRLALLED